MRYKIVTKKCLICEREFESYSGKRKTCSKKCRDIYWNDQKRLCTRCGKQRRELGHSFCLQCGRKARLESYHKHKTCPDAKRLTEEERKEYKRQKDARYRERHREELNRKQRRYFRTHYEITALLGDIRRARKAGVVCDLTQKQWEIIKVIYGCRCAYCGKKPKILTKDHIIPLSKGGGHTANNIVPACRSCNCRKHISEPPPFQPILTWYVETKAAAVSVGNYRGHIGEVRHGKN